jgi:predicted nucleic acid-binding protein
MKPPPDVYFDTSFFIGLLENEAGRQADCKEIVRWERSQNSTIYTSFLTLDEFLVRHYDLNRKLPDASRKADEVIAQIREIANTYGLNDDVAKESARLQSVWGEFRSTQKPALSRDRKFRWDAIHIATAHVIGVARVYAFDGPWNDFPKGEIPNIGEIISPAKPPQPELKPELPLVEGPKKTTEEVTEEVKPEQVESKEVQPQEVEPEQVESEVKPKATNEGGPSESGS